MRNTNSIGTRPFEEAQSKVTRAYAQSGQYHTIVKSRCSSNILYLFGLVWIKKGKLEDAENSRQILGGTPNPDFSFAFTLQRQAQQHQDTVP